jgi:hypothetical protein
VYNYIDEHNSVLEDTAMAEETKPEKTDEVVKITRADLEALVTPSKFGALLGSRRFYALIAAFAVVFSKQFGLELNETEVLSLITALATFILGDSYRKIQ